MVTTLLALALSGCGAAAFSVHDLKVSPSGDTLYVLATEHQRDPELLCNPRRGCRPVEGQLASADTGTMHIGRVMGCHTVRHMIVCSEDDTDCIT